MIIVPDAGLYGVEGMGGAVLVLRSSHVIAKECLEGLAVFSLKHHLYLVTAML